MSPPSLVTTGGGVFYGQGERLGTLSDAPGTGSVRADVAIPYGSVPRDDVAALVEIIERPEVNHVIIELTDGDTPIGAALTRIASR